MILNMFTFRNHFLSIDMSSQNYQEVTCDMSYLKRCRIKPNGKTLLLGPKEASLTFGCANMHFEASLIEQLAARL